MKRALTGGHPLYASAQVHVGWYRQFLPDASGTIQRRSDDKLLGGHAFVIYGYDERGFKIQNSWGSQWANGGFGVLTYDDWAEHGQEVWFVVPRPRPKKVDLVPELPSDDAAASTFSRMWRHLVTLADDGRLSTAGRYYLDKGAVATLLYLFQEQTKHWKCRRLAVFADGGYWATNATVAALEPLRDRLMAAEIYPIFLLWDTPWFDDMQGWLYGQHNLETLLDCDDRDLLVWWNGTIDGQEVGLGLPMAKLAAAESVAPMMWSEIRRRSHAACAGPSGGARALADSIAYKWGQRPFDIHLIAHGAGDLLMSELAQLLPAPVTSASLWAPATTMERFRESYGPMLDDGCLRHLEVFAARRRRRADGPRRPDAEIVALPRGRRPRCRHRREQGDQGLDEGRSTAFTADACDRHRHLGRTHRAAGATPDAEPCLGSRPRAGARDATVPVDRS